MAINATQTAKELISFAVVTDKNGLIKLLQRNGIEMPNNPSDNEVTIAVLMANSKSGVFRADLGKYLSSLVPKVSEFASFVGSSADFGFTGVDDFSFVGEEQFFNLTAAQQSRVTDINPQGKTKVGSALSSIGEFFKTNVLTKENINAGINLGLTSLANKNLSKQNALQTESLQLQTYQDTLRQQLPASSGAQKKSNTMMYVWIGVGVLAVGVVGFLFYKNSKK